VEQADGNLDLENWTNAGDGGDPFPGSTGNRTFDDNSTPNSKTYDGSASGVAVTDISVSDSTMTATMTSGGDTPPSVSIVDPDEGQTVSGTYRVLVSADDDSAVAKVELSIDGVAYIDITANFDGTYYHYDWNTTTYEDGVHTLRARATDAAAQSTESEIVNVTVDNINDPAVATFTCSCSGLTCNFDASGSYDPDGNIATYEWKFDDGSTASGD
jgi:hypothetical protein